MSGDKWSQSLQWDVFKDTFYFITVEAYTPSKGAKDVVSVRLLNMFLLRGTTYPSTVIKLRVPINTSLVRGTIPTVPLKTSLFRGT